MNSFSRFLGRVSSQPKTVFCVILIASLWSFLWYWSWQVYLQSFIWLQLGVGLILFIIPGTSLYGILIKKTKISLGHFTFGFVISHLLFALLGTLARIFHLPFGRVKFLFCLTGLIFILQFLIPIIRDGIKIKIQAISSDQVLPLLMLFLVAGIASLIVIQRIVGDDDLTYLAYLTNWQHSPHLDFQDIVFGEAGFVHPRFWIMSAPFAQALLADITKIPGVLLLGGYYEPFLVILAVVSWYELARTLSFSRHVASASSILQLVFLLFLSDYLHPGASFFTQLSADKATAAFIMAPVFFQSLVQFLKKPTQGSGWIFFLTGLSLTFTHPVILAYSVFIVGVLILLNWGKISIQQKALTIAILIVVLVPHVALRFAGASSQAQIAYTSQDVLSESGTKNMVTQWDDTQFYGFNPAILDMNFPYADNVPLPLALLLRRGWLVFPFLAAVYTLKEIRENTGAQFLLACFLLGILVWIPFTGWIVGYFLSAYMLERALWLFPFGLSLVYIGLAIKDYLKVKNLRLNSNGLLSIITLIAVGMFALYMHEKNLPNIEKFTIKMKRYQGLATAGQELDRRISDSAFVVGSQQLNDFIPGISSKSKIITFRISQKSNMAYFSDAQREERISDTQKIFSSSLSPTAKMSLIEKYDIRFLFLQNFDLRRFEDFIESYPNSVEVTDIGGVILLEIYD